VPARIESLNDGAMLDALAPKVTGLRNLLAGVDREPLRLVVTFGSIIGRTGLRGESHYALANDWLALEVARLDRELPGVRCLNIEWSAWSGAGMAERLGTVAALAQQGLSAIPLETGVELLASLLSSAGLPPSVAVSGRVGDLPTVSVDRPEMPMLRFLEHVLVHQPGIELVVEIGLSVGTDLYLDDHAIDGVAVMPLVFALEAMASSATALTGRDALPEFRDVVCSRPVTVPRDGPRAVRVAALLQPDGAVELSVRSDETGFQVDHVRATCHFEGPVALSGPQRLPDREALDIDPERDIYGGLLFHGPRFRRVERYRVLRARSCVADVRVDQSARWFGAFLPQRLVLGDPGARDAAIHAIQPCIPHERLVPVGVERLQIAATASDSVSVHALERSSDGETYVYDVQVVDAAGRTLERWEGLKLRRIGAATPPARWHAALLGTYLERRASELVDQPSLSLAVRRRIDLPGRRAGDEAIAQLLEEGAKVLRRPDGRPEVEGARAVSAAHLDGYTLAVCGRAPVACDIEVAAGRPDALWGELLGEERRALAELLASESGEEIDVAATRVWAALECMKKAGVPLHEPLKLASRTLDGWTLLRGAHPVATLVTRMETIDRPVTIAVLTA
jgi:enediyne polyketide synthase